MILIALGANLPSRAGMPDATLRAALAALPQRSVAVEAVSPFYRSTAWPNESDPEFINAVSRINTTLSPGDLLAALKSTERSFGRVSAQRNAPRTLDLDIIDYRGCIDNGPPTLPHPRLHERAFVLIPLRDVAPGWVHPVLKLSVDVMIESLPVGAHTLRRLA